jgi:DNA-binding winged helix-turn-helix (wHTH) protein/tetratricopeptide (TPR) repeat protein
MDTRTVTSYEFDAFRVDPLDRRLTRDGQAVPLTPLAFNALLFLIENDGRLVTKAQLLRAIWPDTSVDDPNLAVMISVVRKALGDSGRTQKYIETVAKSGYRFTAELRAALPPPSTPAPSAPVEPHGRVASRTSYTPGHRAVLFAASLAVTILLGVLMVSRIKAGNQAALRIPPDSPETRALYLKGRYSWSRGTENGLKQSIIYFTNAIAADPKNALAYAGLADAYGSLATWSVESSEVAYRKAREAALRAMELNDKLSQAHSALGTISMVHDWDFAQAEREFRRAVELGPRDPIAHTRLGTLLAATGRFDDAIREVRVARDLDPLSLDIGVTLGRVFYYSRRYPEAMDEYRKLVDLDPHYSVAYYYLGTAYFVQGDYEQAMKQLAISSKLVNDREPMALGLYAAARARSGDAAGAQAILAGLLDRSRKEYVCPVGVAFLYMGLGDGSSAMDFIEKTFQDHIVTAVYAGVDPIFDSLRSSSRFSAQVRKVNPTPLGFLPQLFHLALR